MKTKRTPLQWTGHLIGVILSIVVAVIPAGIYGAVWWFIPKTFWPILWTAIGGVVWFIVQLIWALCVALWWDTPPTSLEEDDGNFDSQYLGSHRIP